MYSNINKPSIGAKVTRSDFPKSFYVTVEWVGDDGVFAGLDSNGKRGIYPLIGCYDWVPPQKKWTLITERRIPKRGDAYVSNSFICVASEDFLTSFLDVVVEVTNEH